MVSSTVYSIFLWHQKLLARGRMQLISLAGRHWRVISVIGIWLMVKVMACAPSKGRGGSHDLNCPITIVVRLYISGYGDLLYNIMRQSGF